MADSSNDLPKYFAFDPGDTTGYATFSATGKKLATGQANLDLLINSLAIMTQLAIGKVDNAVFIIEDFKIRQGKEKAFIGSELQVVQAIGLIKLTAKILNAEVVLQPNTIKNAAQGWTGVEPKGAHKNSHWVDAYNHGMFYLIKNRIIEPRQDRNYD